MTTESEARDLLARAAATIEVSAAAPVQLPVRRRRRWLVPVAAAAAVALVVGGGVLLGQRDQAGPAKPVPVEREHVYADDEVPAVLGYTEAEARGVLEEHGLVVETYEDKYTCVAPGFALRTAPGPGTKLEPGERVLLSVSAETPFQCGTRLSAEWRFLRFARGIDASVPVADQLRLVGPDGAKNTIGRELAKDPWNWGVCPEPECRPLHSITGAVAKWATAAVAGGNPVTFGNCLEEGRYGGAITIEPVDPDLPAGACPGTFVELEYDDQDQITTARLVSEPPEQTDPQEPSVLQLPLARHFVKWARGRAGPPAFAPEVAQLHLDGPTRSLTRAEAGERTSWAYRICPGKGPRDACQFDLLAVIDNDPRGVELVRRTEGRGRDGYGDAADLPVALAEKPEAIVEIRPKGAVGPSWTSSHYWSVELWTNESGEIYAVNLRRPPR